MIVLSGGNKGGIELEQPDWIIGEERNFDGETYRKISDEQAIYVGIA